MYGCQTKGTREVVHRVVWIDSYADDPKLARLLQFSLGPEQAAGQGRDSVKIIV